MTAANLPRVFRYNSVELEDPGPEHDPVDVRNLYSATYPEITSAAIEGPETKDGKRVYTFRKAVGTKGASDPMELVKLSELIRVRDLQRALKNIFPTRGSLDWELRTNRQTYIKAGAIFEIAGRLMAHLPTFEKTAVDIGRKKLLARATNTKQ